MDVSYRAAYVPEQEFRDWEDATQLAVAHVEDECDEHDMRGLLVTYTVPGAGYTSHLEHFVGCHQNHVTLRSRTRRADAGPRPTLVYVPDDDLLEVAVGHARGWSLCAVESFSFRLDGWAAATGAVNLDTGEATAPPAPDVVKQLEQLAFYGNNGWGDQFGKRMAGPVLSDLRAAGLDADFIVGYMIAAGCRASGTKRLRSIMESAA
jgi:hypothetical protein